VWALVALPWLTPLVNIFVKLRLWRPRRFTQYSQQALRFSLMLWRISNNKPVPVLFGGVCPLRLSGTAMPRRMAMTTMMGGSSRRSGPAGSHVAGSGEGCRAQDTGPPEEEGRRGSGPAERGPGPLGFWSALAALISVSLVARFALVSSALCTSRAVRFLTAYCHLFRSLKREGRDGKIQDHPQA